MPPLGRAPLALTAALLLSRFADEWAAFLPAGSLEPMRQSLRLSYAEAGLVLAALPAGGLLGNFFTMAADYVSRRLLASLGAAAYGLTLIAFGLGRSLPALLVAAFAWGAASDAFVHGCGVALVDVAGDDLPRALARTNLWSAVGDLLGPLTVTVCALAAFGWRAPFLGLGVSMLGYAAWLASQKLPPPPGRTRQAVGPRRSPLADLRDVLADRRLIPLALALGLFGLLDEPLHAFVIAYLERAAGEGPALAAAPVAAMLAGGMAGYAAYERLAGDGEAGARRAALIAAAALCLFLPAALFAPALALRLAAGLGFGIAGAVFHTALSAAALRLRPGQAGAVSAAVSFIGMIDMGFPALAGMAADAAGLLAAIGLYFAVPPLVLALTALVRRGPGRG